MEDFLIQVNREEQIIQMTFQLNKELIHKFIIVVTSCHFKIKSVIKVVEIIGKILLTINSFVSLIVSGLGCVYTLRHLLKSLKLVAKLLTKLF